MISVIMPCYNAAPFLQPAIESVLNQTLRDFELICVDDGSQDNTLEMLKHYAAHDPRVVVVTQPNSGSGSGAANRAIKEVRGKYIYYFESDDILAPDMLEKSLTTIRWTGADAVLCAMHFMPSAKGVKSREDLCGYCGETTPVIDGKEAFAASLFWEIGAFGLWKSAIIGQYGFYEKGLNGIEYSLRQWLASCQKVAFTDSVYYYRFNEASLSRRFSVRHFDFADTDRELRHLVATNHCRDKVRLQFEINALRTLFGLNMTYYRRFLEIPTAQRKACRDKLRDGYLDLDAKRLRHAVGLTSLEKMSLSGVFCWNCCSMLAALGKACKRGWRKLKGGRR